MIEVCFSPVHLDYHDLGIVRRASSRIAELGMETYSFHAPFADDIDISSPDPHRRKSALEEILRAAEAAAELQVQYFVIHPGPEHSETKSGAERYERRQNVAETLDQVAARCRALGIGCVLENKLPHLLFGNATDIVAILRAIAASGMGACQ